MTCYSCRNCDVYVHISKGYVFNLRVKIGKMIVPIETFLCKKCLKKTGVKFNLNDGWIELEKDNIERVILTKDALSEDSVVKK